MVMRTGWAVIVTIGVITAPPASVARAYPRTIASVSERRWTIDDILTVPIVTDLRLSNDGRVALYATKVADLDHNTRSATLWLVDISTHSLRVLLRASAIEQVRAIPGGTDWSIRADIGAGVQLYRIDVRGTLSPEVMSGPGVRIGSADESVPSALSDTPRRVAVLWHEWSPDGQWLWYALLKPADRRQAIVFDAEIDGQINVRRPPIEAQVEYHLRSRAGADRRIAIRPTSDRVAFYFGGSISWDRGNALRFALEEVAGDGRSRFTQVSVDLATGHARELPQPPANPFGAAIAGPLDGHLRVDGFGPERRLVEDLPGGAQRSYGRVAFLLGDPRSAGSWRSRDGRVALVGTRMIDHPRYGLEWIDRHGRHAIGGDDSLTKCDFTADLAQGVCVRESQILPPELVLVHPRSGTLQHIVALSPRHEAITPLRVTPHQWTNQFGYTASGFIVWPRDFIAGRRYPTIIITHGSDADERFARPDMQWNYPAQVFAEQGYLVLLVNDPAPSQDATLSAAYDQWGSGKGTFAPKDLQRLLWLNGVFCFERAVKEMIASGIVDPERVGIAGYSRGSQMVDVTMTQSTLFRAASSGDGSYLEPYAYSWLARSYQAIFGGSPYGPAIERYRDLAPSLRAAEARGAVLQQLAAPLGGAMDFFRALRAAGVPAQVTFYPGEDASSDETHIFHVPRNRVLAMRENLAWFDFWLRGKRSPIMPFPDRYDVWASMAELRGLSR